MDNKELAQGIVRNTLSNIDKNNEFHDTSFIYKKTNERLQDIRKLFNVRNLLTVAGSGDQVINALVNKPDIVKVFDISVFPIYFMKLKLAAIRGLSRDEFISFFFGDILTTLDEYYDDLYFGKINKYLDKDAKEFWDFLFEFNDWYEIYNSTLFSGETVSINYAFIQNEYLEENKFNQLKNIIPNTDINYAVGNILDLNLSENEFFDLVYLSNIYQYVNLKEYKETIEYLSGYADTIASYVFGDGKGLAEFLDDSKTYEFNDNSAVLTRKKNK